MIRRGHPIIALIVLVAGAPGCGMARHALRAGPARAQFDVVERDLGAVPAGESARASFPVRNSGGSPLRLLSVEGECGCLTPQYPPRLDAGQQAEIRVKFEPQPI